MGGERVMDAAVAPLVGVVVACATFFAMNGDMVVVVVVRALLRHKGGKPPDYYKHYKY
jgi:hypothetical protein